MFEGFFVTLPRCKFCHSTRRHQTASKISGSKKYA
jgi:hypothetical protein